jgi:hypothetical protein
MTRNLFAEDECASADNVIARCMELEQEQLPRGQGAEVRR